MTEPASAVELLAAVLLDANTLLILGHDARPVATEGRVGFAADPREGSFSATAWQGAKGRQWFLACLRGEQMLGLRPSALMTAEGESHRLPENVRLTLEPGEMAAALAGAAGGHLRPVVDFLLGQSGAARLLAELLAKTATPDGFVEIFGRARGGDMYLQGWSDSLATGEVQLLFEAERCIAQQALVATYGRPDLAAPAHGIAAVVRLADGLEPRHVRHVYYWRGEHCYRLDVFENRLLFGDVETAAHAAAMLPQLQAAPAVHGALKQLAAPRYQGQETLPTMSVPVRAAFDMAAWVPGVGIFLVGWMLDPERHVTSVTFGATCGRRVRIDELWTRSQRPDVSQGYMQDPLFAGRIQPFDDAHGFLAFATVPEPDPGDMYLELELDDGQIGFMTVRPARTGAIDVRRILSCVDPNHPDLQRIVETHVGPIVTAAGRQASGAARPNALYEFGKSTPEPMRLSVIVPVPPGRTDIDVTMARLAVEPTLQGVEVIFSVSAAAAAAIGPSLQRQARFYGLSGRLVVNETGDAFDAMAAGAAISQAELLLFLGAAVLPRQIGWLAQLERMLQATPRAAAISPTLLYEDLSIRFAGSRANGWAAPKSIAGLTSYTGYARHWLDRDAARADTAVPVHAVAAECCLIRRAVFESVGGFSGELLGPAFKSLDLSLKLRAARHQCLWASGVEMLAPDEAVAEPEYWMRTGALVDRWGFERKWSQLFA